MLSIKNNMMSANAARHLGINYDSLATSVERLSSGLRINSAKDDAAGMAVNEGIRADVATLQQGSRNAQDGISMLQTAEGAMSVIDDNLVRMKELAEQASTDSYSAPQKSIMNQEFQQLSAEITRIANSTSFNGITMLNSTSTMAINVGSAQTIDVTCQKMDATTLGVGSTKSTATLLAGVADATNTGFITTADTNSLTITFQGESAIVVNWLTASGNTGATSLNTVVSQINSASRAVSGYDAAAAVFDNASGLYSLQLKAKDGGVKTITIANSGAGSLATANFNKVTGTTALDITSSVNAGQALTNLSAAINTKDTYRASLGYMMNRLQSAVRVVDIQAENLKTASSRISDVDVATEMANMTRTNVLAQAGISMLTQANNMPQMATQLLRG